MNAHGAGNTTSKSHAFLRAATEGDVALLTTLLAEGVDINAVNKKNRHALILAVLAHQEEAAVFLYEQGINVFLTDNAGYTAFFYAAVQWQNRVLFSFFLKNGISFTNECERFAFEGEVEKLDQELMKPKAASINPIILLQYAAVSGNKEVMHYLMQRFPINFSLPGLDFYYHPFTIANNHGHLAMVKWMISNWPNLNKITYWKVFVLAIGSGNLSLVKYLEEKITREVNTLPHQINEFDDLLMVHSVFFDGIDRAILFNLKEMIDYLVEKYPTTYELKVGRGESNLNIVMSSSLFNKTYKHFHPNYTLFSKNPTTTYVLLKAASLGREPIIRHLIEKKSCSIRVKDIYGNTPLHLAITHQHQHLVNYLIQLEPRQLFAQNECNQAALRLVAGRANVKIPKPSSYWKYNQYQYFFNLALVDAVCQNDEERIHRLLEDHADIKTVGGDNGFNLIEHAINEMHFSLIPLLLARGCALTPFDVNGMGELAFLGLIINANTLEGDDTYQHIIEAAVSLISYGGASQVYLNAKTPAHHFANNLNAFIRSISHVFLLHRYYLFSPNSIPIEVMVQVGCYIAIQFDRDSPAFNFIDFYQRVFSLITSESFQGKGLFEQFLVEGQRAILISEVKSTRRKKLIAEELPLYRRCLKSAAISLLAVTKAKQSWQRSICTLEDAKDNINAQRGHLIEMIKKEILTGKNVPLNKLVKWLQAALQELVIEEVNGSNYAQIASALQKTVYQYDFFSNPSTALFFKKSLINNYLMDNPAIAATHAPLLNLT